MLCLEKEMGMKGRFIGLLALAVLLQHCASRRATEENPIPVNLRTQLATDFPGAEKVEWEAEGEGYAAEFVLDGWELEVLYDVAGNKVAVETEIGESDLPAPVRWYLEQEYPDAEVVKAEEVVREGAVFYEVDLAEGDREVELLLDDAGQLIEKEEESGGEMDAGE